MNMLPRTGVVAMTSVMVAMMLPSIAPALWTYHRSLVAMRIRGAGARTVALAAGYAAVWAAINVVLRSLDARFAPMNTTGGSIRSMGAWEAGLVIAVAGLVQRSKWKANYLDRCHPTVVANGACRGGLSAAWRDGCRLGVRCSLSCAAPTSVLMLLGCMDWRAMAAVMGAITAERLSRSGVRVARLTGTLAVAGGLALFIRAVALA